MEQSLQQDINQVDDLLLTFNTLLREYQDTFNQMRALVEIGKELVKLLKFLPRDSVKKAVDLYKEKNISTLRIFLRSLV